VQWIHKAGTETSGGLLWTREFHKRWGIFCLAERLLASRSA
jgi:hypothetical protein